MRKIIQSIAFHGLSLYLTSIFFSGLVINGRIESFIVGGFFLSIGNYILRPILQVISLPFQLITLGLFSFVINAAILYITTIIYPNIEITSFTFPGVAISYISIPPFHSNVILSYIIISATIYYLVKIFNWIFRS